MRRLAGKQLSAADCADQLLERRTNEWLGNGRDSRYLFSRKEMLLIRKQTSFITWGKNRRAKEDMIAISKRRYKLRVIAYVLVALLLVIAYPRYAVLLQPIRDMEFHEIPIEYRGLSQGVELSGDVSQIVSVHARGPRDIIYTLNPKSLRVIANLSDIERLHPWLRLKTPVPVSVTVEIGERRLRPRVR